MTRREFTGMLGMTAAMAAAGLGKLWRASAPARFRQAIRSCLFPGRIRPLDESRIRRSGHWLG
jgi:hypothetical protein